jgi:hypothetical protein
MRKGLIPDVYAQSSEYWQDFKEEVRNLYGHGIQPIDKVALHIRRGDYLKVPEFHTNVWDSGYYQKAIKEFPEGTKFLVFCKDNQGEKQDLDDQEWLENNMPLLNIDFELHKHGTETDDLNAMAGCKGIIGANSTFSWWAAFLGNPNKKVVMPREESWFVDGVVRTKLEDNWKQI